MLGHDWQPIHFIGSSIVRALASQSIPSRRSVPVVSLIIISCYRVAQCTLRECVNMTIMISRAFHSLRNDPLLFKRWMLEGKQKEAQPFHVLVSLVYRVLRFSLRGSAKGARGHRCSEELAFKVSACNRTIVHAESFDWYCLLGCIPWLPDAFSTLLNFSAAMLLSRFYVQSDDVRLVRRIRFISGRSTVTAFSVLRHFKAIAMRLPTLDDDSFHACVEGNGEYIHPPRGTARICEKPFSIRNGAAGRLR